MLLSKRSLPKPALVVFVSFVIGSARLAAQTQEPDPHAAQPQRPTVATHAGTMAPGWLEIESGTEFDRYSDRAQGGSVPVLFKVGLAPRVQLELQTPFVRSPIGDSTGVGDFSVGVKWRFIEGGPLLGSLAILPSLKLPTGSVASGTGTGTTDLTLLFISSHKLGPVAMDLNYGYTRRTGDGALALGDSSVWTASFGGPARGSLGWCAELFGYVITFGRADDTPIVAFLAGPTFVLRDWLVLDAGLIVPITGPQPRALYAGVTYNVGRLWK